MNRDLANRLAEFVEAMKEAPFNEQREAIEELGSKVCLWCGTTDLPCYCMRDD